MIKESLGITYAGVHSSQLGVTNVSIEEGLFEEHFLADQTVNFIRIKNQIRSLLIDRDKQPIVHNIRLYFENGFDNKKLRLVKQWLDKDFFEPLQFDEDYGRVYYAMLQDSSSLTHTGHEDNQGYVTFSMICDSPYSYSPIQSSQIYKYQDSKCYRQGYPVPNGKIQIYNDGDFGINPLLKIKKIGNGSVEVINDGKPNDSFKIDNISDGAEITVDFEREIIESNTPNKYYYSDSNENYFTIPLGEQTLSGKGDFELEVLYESTYL
ncbi:hypothetical protein ACI2JA_04180 [Alkalihalobacillus sp. NPDC078783]